MGDGTATLAGANDYQGITDVRQGILVAASARALGRRRTGDTQVQAGAQLQVTGDVTIAEPLAIREGGVGFGNGPAGRDAALLGSVSGTNELERPDRTGHRRQLPDRRRHRQHR